MTTVDPTDLLGHWHLDRTIDDRVGPARHVMADTWLTAEPDGRVRWHEDGTMTWSGGSTSVSRTLFVELRDEGWWVTFEDGRDFHPWAVGEPVVHPCGADTYHGHVTVEGPDAWSVQWVVSGPAKDYTMTSRLSRQAE